MLHTEVHNWSGILSAAAEQDSNTKQCLRWLLSII